MNAEIRRIASSADLDRLLELSAEKPVMLLKHSTRCPTSSWAMQEFEGYAHAAVQRGVECAVVFVVEDRPASLYAAERLGVRHQSPQAILIRDRGAVWHESHERVSAAALEEAERAASAV